MSEETPQSSRNITPKNLLDALAGVQRTGYVSVQQQKQEQRQKEMAKNLDRILDHQDLAKEKMLRIQERLTQGNVSIYWAKLQLETLRRCNDDLQKSYLGICEIVSKDQREEFRRDYFRNEELHNELFVQVQTEIDKLNAAEEERQRGKMNALAPAFIPQQPVVVKNSTPHLQVPLPTFDGSLENWYAFKCMFKTIMSRYPDESPAIKLYHLKNCLVGTAAGKIDQDVINNNDYDSAWKMLEDTYEDERLIIDTHIDALLNLPKMTSENGTELRNLIDTCTKNVDALKNRELPVAGLSEMILINVISKRLDKETRKLWESQLPADELPTYADMMEFLRERGRILQKMKDYNEARPSAPTKQRGKPEQRTFQGRNFVQTSSQSKDACFCCSSGDHLIYKCDVFQGLSVNDRFSKVKQVGLCFNCLRRGHRTGDCNSDRTCKTCKRKHHSLLHEDKPSAAKPQASQSTAPVPAAVGEHHEIPAPPQGAVNCATSLMLKQQVLLSTAEVLVCDSRNNRVACRALLDSGSDSNLICEALARRLKIDMENVNIPISGVNNAETQVKYKICAKISSRVNSFNASLDFLVVPTITTNLPLVKVDIRSWTIPASLPLADPSFHVPEEVQMIIGAELFFELLKGGRMKLADGSPMLVETHLGWIVSGRVKVHQRGPNRRVCQLSLADEQLNRTLVKFWELETCHEASPYTPEEQAIESYYKRTFSRDESGRYTVRLPFNENKSRLGDSMEIARTRFNRLLRSFVNDDKRIRYTEFMAEYLALGHMIEVHDNPNDGYFLPHHAVYKEASSTTKIRVVFDASARTTSGFSLNDALEIGPTVQNDLITILLRFCCFPVALTADIPKMYRQVNVHKDDRKYQRILWLNSKNEVGTFELTTVTYGCSSAPYLATRTLMQLAKDEAAEFPLAAQVIEDNSYIDDFLTGANSEEQAIAIYEQLTELLKRGGFGVHKFCTNSDVVRNSIPSELQETLLNVEDADINSAIKTLGLIWNPNDDYFTFIVSPLDGRVPSTMPTKRSVLSAIGLLFDPCGFIGPVTTTAKLLMQDLWRLKIGWDEELPDDQYQLWTTFREQLPALNKLRKKRCVTSRDAAVVELHGYSDASKRAYGAVLYTRCISPDGTVNVELVCSKSRVAPLKPTTIPRLEPCGTLLLARLVEKTVAAMKIPFSKVTLHTDSQICLSWMKKSPLALNQFVANRVATVHELTQDYEWSYVRSQDNPADIISRGVLPAELLSMDQWFKGDPALWLQNPVNAEGTICLDDSELPELKVTAVVSAAVHQDSFLDLTRMSSFRRLQRAWAYALRFIKICRTKVRITSDLQTQEIVEATQVILRLVQKEEFKELFDTLKDNKKKLKQYRGLAPFIDVNGLIRVGGRLKYSSIPYEGKHQILLPQKHHVTQIIVRQLHEEHFHVGQRGLLSIVRERYWPINARLVIKRIVSKCYVCFRHNPQPVNQFMGNLPNYRITPSPVFSNTGVDYAGPVYLKESGPGRKRNAYKAYIAVFICLATKAIHIEVVSNLTAESFIAALQRFISRRGMVVNMYSDNATNFVGANHELAELRILFEDQAHQRKLNDFCTSKAIQWNFIPPRSPHFGGMWEAGVKSVKHHLKRVVGETKLTFEEMATFLAQCEAILNSRPLIPVSEDPNDNEVLTPSHFLIGRSALCIPEPSYSEQKVGRLNHWQHIQLMKEHFWRRWSAEYLHYLQSRPKWNNDVIKIEIGAMVVLKDDNTPPHQWRIGRIVATHPGQDGVVRVVTVRTTTGEYRRAVSKVCFLPAVDPMDSTGGV